MSEMSWNGNVKKVFNFLVTVLFVGLMPLFAYADEPISVDVSNNCTATDTSGATHTFPQNDSPSDYLGICLLETAKEAGLINFTLTNDPSLGLYIQSVNGINPGATEYWAIWNSGVMASCGIGCIPLLQGDTLSLVLTDWMTNVESTTVVLKVRSLMSPPPPTNNSGGGGGIPNSQLNVANALVYLASKQREDGSFGSPFLSDWVALAFAAADTVDAKVKLFEYMRATAPTLSVVTDYERHAMALLALGIDPYSGTPVDYITPIVSAFDGKQIGDTSLDNDDIFALFPLLHAGYRISDTIIQKTTEFILSRQGQNGSWDGSADMTAAAIQALVQVRTLPDVAISLIRAEGYLRGEKPGSNSFSTSWVRQAISALSWTPSGWTPNSFTKDDPLAELQQSDGGVEPESSDTQTRVWATAYAIPAALGKSWPMLLQSFPKSVAAPTSSVIQITTNTEIATTTATTTPVVQVARNTNPKTETQVIKSSPPPQVAAVASAPATGFFTHLWSVLASFFINLL